MDILSDILHTAGLRQRILHQHAVPTDWSMEFPCDKSIGFHVVLQGEFLATGMSDAPQRLKAGDLVFMARGALHTLKNASSAQAIVVSGAYQLWHDPIHPLFKTLPQWQLLRARERQYGDAVTQALGLLNHEVNNPDYPGASAVSAALLDILFHYILREILHQQKGHWQRAITDPEMTTALHYMHQAPAENWSLERLAKKVGLSRSGFALRFKQTLGDTPAHYLTTLRMSKAMQSLCNTDKTLEHIAGEVGYKDAFAFSKAFKKMTGESPASFRRRNQAEAHLSWRFV